MQLDDLIRATQAARAESAPDPDRLRAGLPARAARRRTRRRLTVAAAVTTVVALFAVVLTIDREDAPQPPVPAASPTQSTSAPLEPVRVPLRLGPAWVPAGYGERFRHANRLDGSPSVTRVWTREPVGSVARGTVQGLMLRVGGPIHGAGTPVDIGGVPGHLSDRTVTWQHDGVGVELTSRDPMSTEDLLRIARSVRPDASVLTPAITPGALPSGLTASAAAVGGDAFMASFSSVTYSRPGSTDAITFDVGRETFVPPGGDPIAVAGRPARLVRADDAVYLIRTLYEPSWTLTVTVVGFTAQPLTNAELVDLARQVTAAPAERGDWFVDR